MAEEQKPAEVKNPAREYPIPWKDVVVAVDMQKNVVRFDFDLPGDVKDRLMLETSFPKAAALVLGSVAGYLLKSSSEMAKFME